MSQPFHTESSLKTRHFISLDQMNPQQKITDLKKEHPLRVQWKTFKTFLKHCVQSTERN